MAYAPPYATALDALNATGNIADNYLAGRLRTVSVADFCDWMEDMEKRPDWAALDIRHPNETRVFQERYPEKWVSIPYVDIRARYAELPGDKTLLIICDAGTRSYEIQRFLESVGMNNTLVLGGGFNVRRRLDLSWWPH